MAITLIKNPIGHKLSESVVTATIIDGSGDAIVYMPSGHALIDGDYVYIQSNFEAYNGYKYVDSTAYDYFKIKDSENSDPVEYVQDADISYQVSVLNHGWQAVHNPIVYELESDVYPNNISEESYIPITIVSQTNNLGYTQLNLSAGIPGGATSLKYIELVGSNDLSGAYQIIDALHPWSIVINLAYDSSNSFSSLQVVNYYNNYAINVRVVVGLPSTHRWESLKPYEVAATLQFIPDNEGKVKFSISDILKSYITTRNNLTLNTLPNNLDFMVSFYIEYYESYDISDGVEITTFEDNGTIDSFVGYAVNAMMPFKNESISHMSEYINEDVYYGRWLTLQDRPIAIVGRFFDLSFINQFDEVDIYVDFTKSLDGVSVLETVIISEPGKGVLRVGFTPESGYDEYCIQARINARPASGGYSSIVLPALNLGTNLTGSGVAWTLGATPSVALTGSGFKESDIWGQSYAFISGQDYEFTPNISYALDSAIGTTGKITFVALDSSDNIVFSQQFVYTATAGTLVTPIMFTAGSGYTQYGFMVLSKSLTSVTDDFSINSLSAVSGTPFIPAIDAQTLTERICMDIVEECDTTFIAEPDDIRLTEDGDFRILE